MHGRHYNADYQLQASHVFVWLAHDRRLVRVVVFLLVLFVVIGISSLMPPRSLMILK